MYAQSLNAHIHAHEDTYINTYVNFNTKIEYVNSKASVRVFTIRNIIVTINVRLAIAKYAFTMWIKASNSFFISSNCILIEFKCYLSFLLHFKGIILAQLLLSCMNRRRMIPMMLGIAAFAVVLSPFIPKDYSTITLLLFLLGKASMTCAYSSIFVFNAELWPTNIRTTIMNTCLMFGRIGSTLAPFTVILVS